MKSKHKRQYTKNGERRRILVESGAYDGRFKEKVKRKKPVKWTYKDEEHG
jgi:hypothetical protein